jgi:hypothetical protein
LAILNEARRGIERNIAEDVDAENYSICCGIFSFPIEIGYPNLSIVFGWLNASAFCDFNV